MDQKDQTGQRLGPAPSIQKKGKSPHQYEQETQPASSGKRQRSQSTPWTSQSRTAPARPPRWSDTTINTYSNSSDVIDGTARPSLWAVKIVTPGPSKPASVYIRDDTGTEPNWIHPTLVEKCNLRRKKCEAKAFRDWHNRAFKCTEYVEVRWVDKYNRTHDGTFYVTARECDVELVLGNEFVTNHGRASAWAVEKRVGSARILVADKPPEAEKKSTEKRRETHNKDAAQLEKLRHSTSKARQDVSTSQTKKKGGSSSKSK